MFWNWVCVEMAIFRCEQAAPALGRASRGDKCKLTHALPGPISLLIETEHKFSVSRTKILQRRDDSRLMAPRRFLHCPHCPDWQLVPMSVQSAEVTQLSVWH